MSNEKNTAWNQATETDEEFEERLRAQAGFIRGLMPMLPPSRTFEPTESDLYGFEDPALDAELDELADDGSDY